VNRSLLDESDRATRATFVGLNVLVLGIAFFWLFANSFHVTETDWIGGLWGLVHALEVMELALAVFLYYMAKDAGNMLRRSRRMDDFADRLAKAGKLTEEDVEKLTAEQYSWLAGEDGWRPFWAEGEGSASAVGAEGRMMTKEEEAIASRLVKLAGKVAGEVVNDLRRRAEAARLEGYREYLYLLLNALAFYGYLVCIVVEYHSVEKDQPGYVRAMLGWMPNGDAGWLGNAVGDFAWTVEPMVILGSPAAIGSMLSSRGKRGKEKAA